MTKNKIIDIRNIFKKILKTFYISKLTFVLQNIE